MSRTATRKYRLDAESRALVESHLPIAYCLAKRYSRRYHLDLEDAQHVAMARLCVAATCYEPSHGVKFVTYAWKAVERALINLAFPSNRNRQRRRLLLRMVPLSAMTDEDGRRGFDPADTRTLPAEEQALLRSMLAHVESLLSSPSEWRSWAMARAYYLEGRTLREIAEREGVSGERVRQLVEWCVGRLRKRAPDLVEGQPMRCYNNGRAAAPA